MAPPRRIREVAAALSATTVASPPARRRRTLIAAALLLLLVLCWAWTVALALDMRSGMTGAAAWMMRPATGWTYATLLFAMWSAMMVAMMLPSATPALLAYARAFPGEADDAGAALRTGAFTAGYLLIWLLFAAAATLAQRLLAGARLLTPMMEPARPPLAASLLLAAGVYQLLPFKRRCLSACRPPAACVASSGPRLLNAFRDGTRHGLLCLGACGALMLLLFAGGVMNLALIAALTLLVLCEKLAPFGVRSTLVSGVLLIGLGVRVLAG